MDYVEHRGKNIIRQYRNCLEMELVGGYVALFDVEDLERLQKCTWHAVHYRRDCPADCRNPKHIYSVTYSNKRHQAHNYVMNFRPTNTHTIDHINRNPRDNRKVNLRIATRSMQTINTDVQHNSSTGIAGVSYYNQVGGIYAVSWYEGNIRRKKCFSVNSHGAELAKQKAVELRKWVEENVEKYAQAYFNRKRMIDTIVEIYNEPAEELAEVPNVDLIRLLKDDGFDINCYRCG